MPTSTTRDRRGLIELAPPAEKAFLVAVDTGDDGGWNAQESLASSPTSPRRPAPRSWEGNSQ